MGFLGGRDGATGTGRPGDRCAVAGCKPSMMVVFFPPQKDRVVVFPAAPRPPVALTGQAARTMVPTLQRGNRSADAPASRQTDEGASTAYVPTLKRWHDQAKWLMLGANAKLQPSATSTASGRSAGSVGWALLCFYADAPEPLGGLSGLPLTPIITH